MGLLEYGNRGLLECSFADDLVTYIRNQKTLQHNLEIKKNDSQKINVNTYTLRKLKVMMKT